MNFFRSKNDDMPQVVYLDCEKLVGAGPVYPPYNPKYDYERKQLFLDVIKIGLGGLVAVEEVLHAATAVLDAYDREFGDKAEKELEEFFASPNEPAAAFPEV